VIIGLSLVASLYLAACHARWLVARHFGQPWRLMGPVLLLDSWDHMRCSGHCRLFRLLVLAWLVAGMALVAIGMR